MKLECQSSLYLTVYHLGFFLKCLFQFSLVLTSYMDSSFPKRVSSNLVCILKIFVSILRLAEMLFKSIWIIYPSEFLWGHCAVSRVCGFLLHMFLPVPWRVFNWFFKNVQNEMEGHPYGKNCILFCSLKYLNVVCNNYWSCIGSVKVGVRNRILC